MLIAYGATFVGQGYSGKPKELTDLITKAAEHKGFAFLNVISPCITFHNTYKVIPPRLKEMPADHDATNRAKAFELALQTEHLLLGVFYQVQQPTFEEGVASVIKKAQAASPPRLEAIFAEFS